MRRFLAPLTVFAVLLGLTGCSAPAATPNRVQIVAGLNVWADIAGAVAGDTADVASLIDGANQDPHEYASTAGDILAVSRADIVIVNGGGYDDFFAQLLEHAKPDVIVIDVSQIAQTGVENEHYWFDLPTVGLVAEAIRSALSNRDSRLETAVTNGLSAFQAKLATLESQVQAISAAHPPRTAVLTEPLPGYLLEAAGFRDVTPSELARAVEAGAEIPLVALQATESVLRSGTIALLATNEQADSAQTTELAMVATAAGVPHIAFRELPPGDASYIEWMTGLIEQIAAL